MGLLNKIALSNVGSTFYKWSATDKGQKFLSQKLPGFETVVASSLYVASTYHQYRKGTLDERRHNLLQTQNILSGVAGYTVGAFASKKSSNYINNTLIPNLKPELIPDAHKVRMGLQVAIPIITTALIVRGIIPAILAWISAKREERKAEQKRLDKLA